VGLDRVLNAAHLVFAAVRGGDEALLSLFMLLVLAAVLLQRPQDSRQHITASRSERWLAHTPAPAIGKSGSAVSRSRRNWHPSITIEASDKDLFASNDTDVESTPP
jgi:hypothetical protein